MTLDKNFLEECFNNFKTISQIIINKRNNDSDINIYDRLVYQVCVYGQSIILENLVLKENTINRCFINRCYIEALTLLIMVLKEKNLQDLDQKMKYNDVILDFNIFKKAKEAEPNIQKKIKSNFDKAKKYIMNSYNLKNKYEFNKFVYSKKFPFGFDNYYDLINKYNKELLESYKILSFLIHPGDARIAHDFITCIDLDNLENNLILNTFNVIKSLYTNIPTNRNFIDKLSNIIKSFNDPDISPTNSKIKKLSEYYREYESCLNNIITASLEKSGNNIQIHNLIEWKNLVKSLIIHKLAGLDDVIVCKYKCFIEYFSIETYLTRYLNSKQSYIFKLFSKFTRIRVLKEIGEDVEDLLKSAFEIAKNNNFKLASKGYDAFKTEFPSYFGYLEEPMTISKLIEEQIKDTFDEDKIKEYISLYYNISNALSHANGYMLNYLYRSDDGLIVMNIILSYIGMYVEYFAYVRCKTSKYGSDKCPHFINVLNKNVKNILNLNEKILDLIPLLEK